MPQEFHDQLISFMPKMRVWALALTRNRAAADDLTQDVATKALVAKDCFIPGTNFSAWVHRIMINHFISSVRSKREFTDTENMPEIPVAAAHEDRTALRELGWALERLPTIDRLVLEMATFELHCRPETPAAVAINEAVSLAKRFSTEDSGRFVNGVLSAVVNAKT